MARNDLILVMAMMISGVSLLYYHGAYRREEGMFVIIQHNPNPPPPSTTTTSSSSSPWSSSVSLSNSVTASPPAINPSSSSSTTAALPLPSPLPTETLQPPPPQPPLWTEPVLVLGSGGLVGRGLVKALLARGYRVEEVRGRTDCDLRRPQCMNNQTMRRGPYRFAFFLACEVGGSRFLDDPANAARMERHNAMMYASVFPALRAHNVSFIFASSQLVHANTSYGHVKRRGEELALRHGGKSVRFWNVYGMEALGGRSHVLFDWLHGCLTKGAFRGLTTGHETRYFTHAEDIGRGLLLLMERYAEMATVEDLTRLDATSLLDIAAAVVRAADGVCQPTMGETQPTHRQSQLPRLSGLVQQHWHPAIDVATGLRMMRAEMEGMLLPRVYVKRCREQPLVSLVFATRGDRYGEHGTSNNTSIWARTVTSLRFFIHFARAVALPFEIVVGEYNPRPHRGDIPLSQMPWPAGALYRIRTVPHGSHIDRARHSSEDFKSRQTPDSFWEYSGKNAAARAARGEYLILFNPDNIVHPETLALLARGGLRPTNVYRARRRDHPLPTEKLIGMSAAALAATLPPLQPLVVEGADDGESPNQALFDASGDFTMLSKARFMEVGGYPELPWNMHMDSLGLWRFLCVKNASSSADEPWYPTRTQVFLEQPLWHQNHARPALHQTPWDLIFQQWPCTRRQEGENWGFGMDPHVTDTVIDRLEV